MLPRGMAADVAGVGTRHHSRCDYDLVSSRRSASRTFVSQCGLVALALLLSTTTIAAQSATPDAAIQPEAEQAPPLTSADVARAALDANHQSLRELQRLQLRENELWQLRKEHARAGPGIGLGFGVAGAATLIPFGVALLAVGHTSDDATYDGGIPGGESDDTGEPLRITGGMLLGLGVVALITAVACGVRVRQLRPIRRAADQELRTIRLLRVRILDAIALRSEPGHAR